MSMPTWEDVLRPLLELVNDGKEHSLRDAIGAISERLKLTKAERAELLPSGVQPRFDNRVGWASTALKKAGLLSATKRGFFQITDAGRLLLGTHQGPINKEALMQYPGYAEFKQLSHVHADKIADPAEAFSEAVIPPLERLTAAYAEMSGELESELLSKVRAMPPDFFERLVVDLLHRMGYGGSIRDAAQAIGRSGDGGIDGVIKEDALGLDKVYVQAKRYTTNNVPGRDVRDFKGALDDRNARKGVFITTSGFASDALDSAAKTPGKSIVLIDGRTLAKLMLEHGVGTTVVETYTLHRLDEDYFDVESAV